MLMYCILDQGRPLGGGGGGNWGIFPGPQPERGPRRPHEGPPEYLFKRSIYSNRAVRSKYSNRAVTVYSSEKQCSKLIDKEIWLVMGSYCHCQQVVTFFFFFFWSSPYNLGEGPHFNSLPWVP